MVSSGIRFESGRLLSPGTLSSSAVLSSKPFRSHTHSLLLQSATASARATSACSTFPTWSIYSRAPSGPLRRCPLHWRWGIDHETTRAVPRQVDDRPRLGARPTRLVRRGGRFTGCDHALWLADRQGRCQRCCRQDCRAGQRARSAGVGCARWPEAHVPHSMMANNVAQQRLANYAAWILAKSASTSVTGIASISQTAPTISRRSCGEVYGSANCSNFLTMPSHAIGAE